MKTVFLAHSFLPGDRDLVIRSDRLLASHNLRAVTGRRVGGGDITEEVKGLNLLGEVTARRDPPEHADGHYRDALALAEELGMRPLVAHCHLGLGKLYRRTGKREKAQEQISIAATMYREMGMRFWLEQAEAEMGV